MIEGVVKDRIVEIEARIRSWEKKVRAKENEVAAIKTALQKVELQCKQEEARSIQLRNLSDKQKKEDDLDIKTIQEEISKTKIAYEEINNKYTQLKQSRLKSWNITNRYEFLSGVNPPAQQFIIEAVVLFHEGTAIREGPTALLQIDLLRQAFLFLEAIDLPGLRPEATLF